MSSPEPAPLLTTTEVAELLQINPKRVYRLVKEGLPARRLGGEWRFVRRSVLDWVERGGSIDDALPVEMTCPPLSPSAPVAPPFLAANGDVAIEHLLAIVNADRPVLGFVQADRGGGLRLLGEGAVLAAGSHGKGPPARLGEVRLARIHLVQREVGLVVPKGRRLPKLSELPLLRFAGRRSSAGVVAHFEKAVREAGLDLQAVLAQAHLMDSHRDVALAVLRGDADVGLLTRAWAARAGLGFRALAGESYGLLVRASDLGDHRVVRLCEVAQSDAYRRLLATVPGYDAADAGVIRYDPEPAGEL